MGGVAGNTLRTCPCCAEISDFPYMFALDTHPINPSRAPNPAISVEYGNFTFTEVSVRPGSIFLLYPRRQEPLNSLLPLDRSEWIPLSLKRMKLIDNSKT